MKTIITTVGASLFENYMSIEVEELLEDDGYISIRKEFRELKDNRIDHTKLDLKGTEEKKIIKQITAIWLEGVTKNQDNEWGFYSRLNDFASAEIESIIKIADSEEKVRVYLICTDTVLSVLAAELICKFFNLLDHNQDKYIIDFKLNDDNYIVNDLQVNDKDKFEKKGLINLFNVLNEVIKARSPLYTVLNITGGYKGLIPFMTIFGQINQVPIYYLFEDTGIPLKIPQTPINIDWAIIAEYSDIFSSFKNGVFIKNDTFNWSAFKIENSIPDIFDNYITVSQDESDIMLELNALGSILYARFDQVFFVDFVITSSYFKEDPYRKKLINNSLIELKRRIDIIGDWNGISRIQDGDVTHCQIDNTWIYKDKQSNQQIRIQYKYSPKDELITFYNYIFKNSYVDYEGIMKRQYPELKSIDNFLRIGFLKN